MWTLSWPSAWQPAWACRRCPPAPPAAEPVQDLPLSPALRIIDRMKPTLEGRCVGLLVDDGSNAKSVAAFKKAVEKAGATVKIVAPKVGGAKMDDGSRLPADGQLAGTPSTVFDAVASILSTEMGNKLSREAAAVDWFRDAFGHLKAIGACPGSQAIVQAAGIEPDAGVVDPKDSKAFIAAAQTRQWDREPTLRTLA